MGSAMILHSRVTRNLCYLSTSLLLRSKDTRKYTVLVGSLQVFGHPVSKTMVTPVSRIIPSPDLQGHTSGATAVAELAYPFF